MSQPLRVRHDASRCRARSRRRSRHASPTRRLPAGTRLGTKSELRAEFGVASTTVNEALRLLETRGLVRTKRGPGGGIFVSDPSGWLALSELVLGLEALGHRREGRARGAARRSSR